MLGWEEWEVKFGLVLGRKDMVFLGFYFIVLVLGFVVFLICGLGIYVQVVQLFLSLKDNSWYYICIVWITRDGLWFVYQDGELRGFGENLAVWYFIKFYGIFIFGQEQVRFRVISGFEI